MYAKLVSSLLQVGQSEKRRLLLLDYCSVHRDGRWDNPAHQVGLAQILAMNKNQQEIEEALIQVVERLEQMPSRVVDGF
jgi:hypothetical protein